ncbi:MAG: hypothetical protein L3J91_01520, partial [Thermoplasmata archaeon]|nr:hypothetical protein [Thermoplasmata archaeon]
AAGSIRGDVVVGRLHEARSRTLLWAIIGLFPFVLYGLLFGVVYFGIERAIALEHPVPPGPMSPAWASVPPPAVPPVATPPPGAVGPVPPAPPAAALPPAPPVAPPPPGTPHCVRCGRPATGIVQYSRWYCYTDQLYL